jgi:hypothetical protein
MGEAAEALLVALVALVAEAEDDETGARGFEASLMGFFSWPNQ